MNGNRIRPRAAGPRANLSLEKLEDRTVPSAFWSGYARDPQHTGVSAVASQSLDKILWSTPVDLNPQYNGNDLLIHYGSPVITSANTVLVPVKTGASDGFQVESHSGADGTLRWTLSTDFSLPPHGWVPSYSPTLTPSGQLYYPGAGGTVYYVDNPDSLTRPTPSQLAFYGMANYTPNIKISTPITSDAAGNIYFGYKVVGSTPFTIYSGIARIDTNGVGSWLWANTVAQDSGIQEVVENCAPAVSADGNTLYVAVSAGDFHYGYLGAIDLTGGRFAPKSWVLLRDPNGNAANLPDDGTASPTVGPDGDVYMGVLENPFPYNNDRGWLLHYSGDLSAQKPTGAFGWDDTATVVPASMVPSYGGTSAYLLFTKYNNYSGVGSGNGQNKIAVLDPNATQTDPVTGNAVMKEVLTALGQTPDPEHRGGVREWCINTAAVDPATKSILANSEDGKLYRWDLSANALTQVQTLTTATGEAYTPTLIGPDGAVYAINRAVLYAVGQSSANQFRVSAPVSVTAGDTFSITVTAQDSQGQTLSGYEGTVSFTSSDPKAVLPTVYTFTAADLGSHTFTGVQLFKAGSMIVTADDDTGSGTAKIKVNATAVSKFQLNTPIKTVTQGTPFNITVVAEDTYGNVVKNYTDTVNFSSSDTAAVLPGAYTFTAADKGKHAVSITLNSTGSQTVQAADASNGTVFGKVKLKVNAPSAPVRGMLPAVANREEGFGWDWKRLDEFFSLDT